MSLEYLVETYGYLAILVGSIFEGEMVLVVGGFFINSDYLDFYWVTAAAFAGATMGDHFFFLLGRYKGQAFLARRQSWKPRVCMVEKVLERHAVLLILGFRFLYGLRGVTPFAIGVSRVPVGKFVALNLAGALVWAVVVTSVGYAFGEALEAFLGNVKRYERGVFVAMVGVGAGVWVFRWWRKRVKRRREKIEPAGAGEPER